MPPASVPPEHPHGRETVPGVPERLRSPAPREVGPQRRSNLPPSHAPQPSLFDIATWIDAGRHRDAIAAINRAGPNVGPGYSVMRARALAAAGYVEQALSSLEQLEHAPDMDAELHAACSRLFADLGRPGKALSLAQKALEQEPDRPLLRLTCALAAVRAARRNMDDVLLDRADQLLDNLNGREGPMPAVYQALRACIEASRGDPERAISLAQRALGLDPRSPDALAAVAEASARLGRGEASEQAWAQLHEVAPFEADALGPLLARIGTRRLTSAKEPETDLVVWAPAESELGLGRRPRAQTIAESAAHEIVRRMVKPASQSGATVIAGVAATFLTTTQVFSSFSPFDLSLFSVARVDAALDVLYGPDPRPRLPTSQDGLVLLLGSYLGEALRIAHGAKWDGNPLDLEAMRVVTPGKAWFPYRAVAARLLHGKQARLREAFASALGSSDPGPWRMRIPSAIAAPAPWAPRSWPRPSQISAIGRSLALSPIGAFCAAAGDGPLDSSTASLISLDTYLDLVAPRDAPADGDAAATRKLAVLVGSYVGETLRAVIGGDWTFGVDSADDANDFKLELRGGTVALPVAHVHERVAGSRSSSLVDYAKTIMRRAGRV
jgi:tetratricopeptide (TPR) repeat protein